MHLPLKALTTLLCSAVLVMPISPAVGQQPARVIEIHAKRFAFTPAEITLVKGQPVTLALTSDDAPHSLLIEGLGVNAPMTKGKVTSIKVTPQKAGDFKGRCGHFCGSGHGTMIFTVHVTDK